MTAGALVLIGVTAGLVVHPGFFALAAFMGAGLFFAGASGWCGMALLLKQAPWNKLGPQA
jgi:predicted branched-subunit amino acid permease